MPPYSALSSVTTTEVPLCSTVSEFVKALCDCYQPKSHSVYLNKKHSLRRFGICFGDQYEKRRTSRTEQCPSKRESTAAAHLLNANTCCCCDAEYLWQFFDILPTNEYIIQPNDEVHCSLPGMTICLLLEPSRVIIWTWERAVCPTKTVDDFLHVNTRHAQDSMPLCAGVGSAATTESSHSWV